MSRMNKTPLVTALVLTGSVLLSAGNLAIHKPQTPYPYEQKEVRLTEKQGACGSGVGLNVGDTLELEMESNLAGYVWEIGFNVPAVLKVTGWPSRGAGSGTGGGATQTNAFHLTAVGEGEEALRLVYCSSIDGDALPLRICDVKVVVTE